MDSFLARYLGGVAWFPEVPHVFTLDRDPKDSKYVNLALAGGAPYLVTTDRDLLDLMDPTTDTGRDFLQRFPTLQILDIDGFLQAMAYQEQASPPADSPESPGESA